MSIEVIVVMLIIILVMLVVRATKRSGKRPYSRQYPNSGRWERHGVFTPRRGEEADHQLDNLVKNAVQKCNCNKEGERGEKKSSAWRTVWVTRKTLRDMETDFYGRIID